MIRYILSWIEFFIICFIHIKSVFQAALIVNKKEYVTPNNIHKYKKQIEKHKVIMLKRKRRYYHQRLPNEILNLIFNQIVNKSDLLSCLQVSKQWNTMVLPILWKSSTPIKPLLSCLPAFAEIDKQHKLNHTHQPSHFSPFFNLKLYGHYIKSLDLSKIASYVTDCTIKYISLNCPNLVSINLSYCIHVSDSGLEWLSRNNGIKHLVLNDCRQLSDIAIKQFYGLQSLDISRCHGITEKGISLAIITNGRTLRHISVNDVTHMTFSLLSRIAHFCGPRLQSLSISRTKLIQNKHLLYIADHCPNLVRLELAAKSQKASPLDDFIHLLNRHDIQASLSPAIAQQYESLMQQHVSNQTITYITDQLKHLEHLDLSNWHSVDDQSLATLSSHPQLSFVNLIGCQRITQRGIESMEEIKLRKTMTILLNHCTLTPQQQSSSDESEANTSFYCN